MLYLRIMRLEERIVLNAVVCTDAAEDDAPEPEVLMHDPFPAEQGETASSDDSGAADATGSAESSGPTDGPREIVVVDSSVADAQEIADVAGDGIEVIVVGRGQNGVQAVAQVLANRREVSAIHVLSHGAPGQISIGASVLELSTLDSHAADLQTWAQALTPDGDILLYGCATAQGSAGLHLVQGLADLTDADVAASTDDTTSVGPAANWTLEYATGPIEADALLRSGDIEIGLDTITVTSLADESDGGAGGTGWSLRDAVLYANTHPGEDTIELPAGTYRLDIAGQGEDNGATGDLDILDDLTINGAGADLTVIDANDIDRALDLFPGVELEVRAVTITGGSAPSREHGGGLRNDGGSVSVADSVITSNTANRNGHGGGGSTAPAQEV